MWKEEEKDVFIRVVATGWLALQAMRLRTMGGGQSVVSALVLNTSNCSFHPKDMSIVDEYTEEKNKMILF